VNQLSLIALPLILWSAAAGAQPVTPPPVAAPAPATPAPKPALVKVVMTTSLGPITLELERDRAPLTTANFLRYVDQKRLDGITFYRAMKIDGAPNLGLIQGGAQNDPKRLLPPIKHEATTQTGISHMDGTISMARGKPGSATADFFITVGALTTLDANPKEAGDSLGFAAFGRVTEGMEIVRKIWDAPRSATAGIGFMKGQMLAPPVKVLTVRRGK
jgi:peptidyl-prolyl cis-trans isomerase A (cyclophilin A)